MNYLCIKNLNISFTNIYMYQLPLNEYKFVEIIIFSL